ncbi:amino acid adenylation domain-containing protein [Paenibacillus sp. N1-5-1-14]|uniref:non-ribosomal peptide synthetase family protein n=1 Tax=Paenibacillus radicibacter TaxID=2972488 RepID=UPI0021590262|nr:non-ribosomal peptide synthetase [Paenibacillus radicibacter]MCR8642739.1 amino acid adenylation domain-containing protein [Paenibacillus radicibacter]
MLQQQLNSSILNENLPVLQIPLDFSRHTRTYTYTRLEAPLHPELNKQMITAYNKSEQHLLFLTTYMAWTYRLSNENELCVVAANANGTLAPIVISIEGNQSYQQLAATLQDAWNHTPQSTLPIQHLESILSVNAHAELFTNPKFMLHWQLIEDNGSYRICVEYDQSLFTENTMTRYIEYYTLLLTAAMHHPTTAINSTPLLTQIDKDLYEQLNDTQVDYPTDKTIHQMFEHAAATFPSHCAIASSHGELSYVELNARANQFARLLVDKGLRKGDFVTILMERSLETIISILGIMKAGGAYVPVDPEHPEERNSYIIEDTKSAFVVTKESYVDQAKHLCASINTVREVLLLDERLDTYETSNLDLDIRPDDLAYIIYTSGSTGRPKGALIAHEGVVNLGAVVKRDCSINEHEVLTQFATYSFDASVWDTVGALFYGAKLYLLSPEERISVEEFADAIARTKTTIITILPTVFFNQLATYLSDEGFKKLAKVKLITVAGEALYGEMVRAFQRKFGEQIDIVNVYGPTECTVATTTHRISGFIPDDLANVPIGRPIHNYKVYIVNEADQLCPANVPGELYVSTVALAKGYLNQPDRTEQSFVPNPFAENDRIYKSGDIVRLLENGTIEYVGRRDSQIKIRGHRIEIGEIEDCLSKYPNVQDVAIIPKKDQENQNMLAAFFTSQDQSELAVPEIRKFLVEHLPSYFVPKFINQIEQMPIAPTGKLDRKKLALIELAEDHAPSEDYVAPENEVQRIIVEAWEEVLSTKPIGINDDYFQVGGDSLKIMRLLVLLKPHFAGLRINDFFQYKTVAELALRVETLAEEDQLEEVSSGVWEVSDLDEHPVRVEGSVQIEDYALPKHVLITGTTGYLGSHLLYELLQSSEAHMYCLVRKSATGASLERLEQIMTLYFGDKIIQAMHGRVTIVEGDLEVEQLGLSEADRVLLHEKVDTILHSAADVRHFGDVASFAKTNIHGTQYLLDIAQAKKGVRFHHVSTIGVPEDLAMSGQWESVCEKPEFADDLAVENVYTNSKLEAEKLLLDAGKNGTAVTIYRAGNLTCHSETGRFQKNIDSNAFYRMIKAMILLGKAPEANWYVDFTPIDYASKSIVHFVMRKDTIGRLLHIVNPKPILYSSFVNMIREYGYEVETMKFKQYENWVLDPSNNQSSEALQLAMAQLEGDGAKDSNYRYGCAEASKMLEGTKVACPEANSTFIRKMIDHAVEIGYFPAARVLQEQK